MGKRESPKGEEDSKVNEQFAKQIGGNHYDKYTIEPIEALKSWLSPDEFRGFLRGSALKYQVRYRDKHGIEDLKKAQWFLNALIEFERHSACVEVDVEPKAVKPAPPIIGLVAQNSEEREACIETYAKVMAENKQLCKNISRSADSDYDGWYKEPDGQRYSHFCYFSQEEQRMLRHAPISAVFTDRNGYAWHVYEALKVFKYAPMHLDDMDFWQRPYFGMRAMDKIHRGLRGHNKEARFTDGVMRKWTYRDAKDFADFDEHQIKNAEFTYEVMGMTRSGEADA